MRSRRRAVVVATVAVASALPAVEVAAQTGPDLLIAPFRRDDQFELENEYFVGLPTQTNRFDANGDPEDIRLDGLRVESRLRLTPGESDAGLARAQPRAGFALNTFQFDTDDPFVPRRISDGSVGFGMGILAVGGYLGGFTVGVGYASASGGGGDSVDEVAPFLAKDGNAAYLQANFAIGKEYESGDTFGLVLSYDGNRTILPDVPLPGFQYRREFSDDLALAVGFPFNGLEWQATERLNVDIQLSLPNALSGEINYDIGTVFDRPIAVYASVSSRTIAAHWDEVVRGRDRVFFSQRLAELGLSIQPGQTAEEFRFILAGGWAFDRDIEEGWDTRDLDLLAEIEDGPFLRAAIELKL